MKIRKVNHENIEVMFHFGLDVLFDGYLIKHVLLKVSSLIIRTFLFDGYLILKEIKLNE